jgi:hypothetical protein
MYEIEYFLILRPGSVAGDAYERIGLLGLHMDIRGLSQTPIYGSLGVEQGKISKIEEIQMAIRESSFENVTIK